MCKPLPKFHYSKIRAVQMCKPKRPRKKLKKTKTRGKQKIRKQLGKRRR